MAGIKKPKREIQVEPVKQPRREKAPAAPQEAPKRREREKVPA